jgi:ABC-type glycerol-3-phosphate transport system permease component
LILWHAVIPQIRPAIAALAVMVFCESWNMVEPALIFASKNPGIHPLSVRLGDLPEPVSFGAAMVYMYPILLLFLMFKETLASSMEKFRWD